ncbi:MULTISPECIES: TonB-dependent receptor domain-containing protein [unclassified Moraxella]|uniref:TonB-dependent receptor domain-containing protein n=1 Tax=unclassified Moraxella TaxID=2685852 RepID=UPI003AF6E53F
MQITKSSSSFTKNLFKLNALTLGLVSVVGTASANTNPPTNTNVSAQDFNTPVTNLPDLTVTATRTPTLVKNIIAQTTVIDETDLQRYHGQSVLDVLRQQSGVYITQNGGDGSSNGIKIRGYGSNAVLVLIDGVRYSSATTGIAPLSLIPADQIDRIEVLYGASGSSLYGADAMGGVVQIFTKGQNADQSNVAVTVGAGTQDSYKGQVTGQLVTPKSTLSLSGGYEKTEGINATNSHNTYSYYPDKDGFESKNASLVAKYQLNQGTEVGLTGIYNQSTSDMDSGENVINAYANQKNGAVTGFLNYQKQALSAQFKYGQSFDKSTTYDGADWETGRLDDVFDTTQDQASLQLGYRLPVGQLMAGYEQLKQQVETSNYDKKDRTIKSVFTGYQLTQDKYDAQINVRNDDNSQFGNETTYNVGGAYRILPHTRVGASYATGFRAPTFNDLYWKGSENPNLKAETSQNTEVFVENRTNLQKTRLTGYTSDVKDKLTWVTTNPQTYQGQMQNVEKVKIKGVNLSSDWTVANKLFGLSYDYSDVTNQTTNKALVYQPKHQGLVYVGYRQPQFDIRGEVQHIGERYRDASNTNQLDGYTLLNISSNYYINQNLTINARLNNLTGENYETVYGYNQKGVNAFVSATYKWF